MIPFHEFEQREHMTSLKRQVQIWQKRNDKIVIESKHLIHIGRFLWTEHKSHNFAENCKRSACVIRKILFRQGLLMWQRRCHWRQSQHGISNGRPSLWAAARWFTSQTQNQSQNLIRFLGINSPHIWQSHAAQSDQESNTFSFSFCINDASLWPIDQGAGAARGSGWVVGTRRFLYMWPSSGLVLSRNQRPLPDLSLAPIISLQHNELLHLSVRVIHSRCIDIFHQISCCIYWKTKKTAIRQLKKQIFSQIACSDAFFVNQTPILRQIDAAVIGGCSFCSRSRKRFRLDRNAQKCKIL